MMKLLFVAAMTASALATPAFAQEYRPEIYAGVIAGGDRTRISEAGDSGHKDGLVYGGVIGIQTSPLRGFQFGVEGEVTGSTTKQTERNIFAAGDSLRVKMGRDFFIGARAGVRPSPGLLVYGKIGYTNGRIAADYSAPAAGLQVRQNVDGYRASGGVEVGSGKLRLRAEYRYSNYGDLKFNGAYTGIKLERHQLVGGAIFFF